MQISNKQHFEAVSKGRTDRFPAFRNQSAVCLRKEDWTYFQHPSNHQSEEQSSIVGAMSEAKSKLNTQAVWTSCILFCTHL